MELSPDQRSLERLSFAIEMGQGQFKLIVVRCSYWQRIRGVMKQLKALCPVEVATVMVRSPGDGVLERVTETLAQAPEAGAVAVYFAKGLDREDLTQIFGAANRAREVFRDRIQRPIVLWLDDQGEAVFMDAASDLESLSTGATLSFEPDRETALEWVRSLVDGWVDATLRGDWAAQVPFVAECRALLQQVGAGERSADLWVVEGRACWAEWLDDRKQGSLIERADGAYRRALEVWADTARDDEVELWRRAGIVQVWLAELWRSRGKLARGKYFEFWRIALKWQDDAIATFREAGELSVVAQFLPDLGAELQRLGEWKRLRLVGEELVGLSQEGPLADGFRLAQGFGFLGKVALEQQDWKCAENYFEQALDALGDFVDLELKDRPFWAWLMLSRSRALWGLGLREDALHSIKSARIEMESTPERGPRLTVALLNQARDFYYATGEFEEAFKLKRSRRSIEQQFRLKAFVGAGQVKAARQEELGQGWRAWRQSAIAEEIEASGRKEDVDALMLRIENTETRLTVICGFSGVGKSSLVAAGLVPAIAGKDFGNLVRRGIPIVVRRYDHWREELVAAFAQALIPMRRIPTTLMELFSANLDHLDKESLLLRALHQCEGAPADGGANAKPVLILDQFEDFFTHRSDRRDHFPLFNFLGRCLKEVLSLDIVVSIRRDYVHHLLDWPMLKQAAGEGTLSDSALFLVDDFSRDRAIAVMERLCQQVDFGIDSESVAGIVDDLAAGNGARDGEEPRVRPVELQLVGAQLEAQQLRSLAAYREAGGKLELVRNYLDEVKEDCGPRLQELAGDVLVLLVGDAKTGLRPAKGRSRLKSELAKYEISAQDTDLDWILKVLVGSGIAFELPAEPEPKFQLVHDYLAEFIRDNEQPLFQQVLAAALEKRAEAERSLAAIQKEVTAATQDRQKLRRANRIGVGLLSVLIVVAGSVGFLSYSSVKKAGDQIETAKNEQEAAETQKREADYLRRDAEFREAKAELFIAQQNPSLERLARIGELTHTLELESIRLVPMVMQSTLLLKERRAPPLLKSALYNHLLAFPKQVPKLPLKGHKSGVLSASFSPDGNTIVTASDDGTAKLWDRDGKELQTLSGHQNPVWSASFSPDGNTIVTASSDGTAKLWPIETLDSLLTRGCNWLRNGLSTHPNVPEDLRTYCKFTGDSRQNS